MTRGRRLRVLHVIPGFFPAVRYGGPIESVLRLCQALHQRVDVEVATTDADGRGHLDVPIGRETLVEGVRVRYFGRWLPTGYAFAPGMYQYLRHETKRFDLVHVTAAFSFPSTVGCVAARRASVPYIVSPRGSCQGWAMGQKRWKKLPYWHLVEHNNLAAAAALHATSDQEGAALRDLVPNAELITVPNGVIIPERPPGIERSPNRILFLGRLHPVKGLDRLMRALGMLGEGVGAVETILAGPDDVGEWKRLEVILSGMRPRPSVRYLGPVHGSAKSELLASATFLVLPSHTENFGQVVVEALAHATPVIVSRGAPWQVVEERGAGLWVENDPASLAHAMKTLLLEPTRTREMGVAAARLAHDFGWEASANAMADAYERVVARGLGGR